MHTDAGISPEPTARKQWLSPQEVSREYGINMQSLARWRMEKLYLPFSKIGRFVKYNRDDVERFLKSNRQEAL